jgi:hypothetical protein
MALPALAAPLGLAALLALVPLIVLYIIQPDPRRLELPTMQFLADDSDEGGSNPIVERLRRNLLFFLQVLAIVLLALALGAPFVLTTQAASDQQTVVVVDASASMQTGGGDGARFAAARAAAKEEVGTPTTVVVAGATTRTAVTNVAPGEARTAIDGLSPSDAPADLRGAIARATSLTGSEGRVVVVSDFATDDDWQSAVQTARARGVDVHLEQVGSGPTENVGIIDRRFTNERVILSVKNTGSSAAERRISLGQATRRLTLQPGDVTTVTFPQPNESATATLAPRDAFRPDDVAHVTVPEKQQLRVLLLTNGDDRYLRTALSVLPAVELTVVRPPEPGLGTNYDIVIFNDVDGTRLLQTTVEKSRDVLADGGGVAIQAQENVGEVGYGDTLPIESRGVTETSAIGRIEQHPLTRGFDFPAPDRHLAANVTRGTALVETEDGSPLLATARRSGGRVLYYGYLPDEPAFRYSYRYPVFWKAATNWLGGRASLADLNRRTGETWDLGNRTTVQAPNGERTAASVQLDAVGLYETEDRRVSASLLDARESNVSAPALAIDAGGRNTSATAGFRVRQDLTPVAVALVLLVALGELYYLRYRGDV